MHNLCNWKYDSNTIKPGLKKENGHSDSTFVPPMKIGFWSLHGIPITRVSICVTSYAWRGEAIAIGNGCDEVEYMDPKDINIILEEDDLVIEDSSLCEDFMKWIVCFMTYRIRTWLVYDGAMLLSFVVDTAFYDIMDIKIVIVVVLTMYLWGMKVLIEKLWFWLCIVIIYFNILEQIMANFQIFNN